MSRITRLFSLFVAVVALWGSVPQATAADFLDDRISLQGYAHQTFLLNNSHENKFFGADWHGSFEDNALALLFFFKATDDLTIWTQIFADTQSKLRLDWAFADYRLTDWLRVRAGQIKTPLGLLNETRDIKYLHLTALEPYLYQEAAEIMFEAVRGASIELEHEVAGGELKLDLYGGAPVFFEMRESDEKHYGLLGARLQYETPVPGLKLGGTYLIEREKKMEAGEEHRGYKRIYGGSAEYKNAGLSMAGEYFAFSEPERKGDGYYLEAGYTLFDKLTPYARYDYITLNKDDRGNPPNYQQGVTFGVSYTFNKYAKLKVEDSVIKGFALPAVEHNEGDPPPPPLDGNKHWNLFAVSLNLIF